MKLVELKCRECGAQLSVVPNTKDIHCAYCKANYKLDDEVIHVEFDNLEEASEAYARKRQKAIHEKAAAEHYAQVAIEQKRQERISKAITWILFFPVMLTIWTVRRKEMSIVLKIAILTIVWALYIALIVFFAHYGLR